LRCIASLRTQIVFVEVSVFGDRVYEGAGRILEESFHVFEEGEDHLGYLVFFERFPVHEDEASGSALGYGSLFTVPFSDVFVAGYDQPPAPAGLSDSGFREE
jgi:hypothetical protein